MLKTELATGPPGRDGLSGPAWLLVRLNGRQTHDIDVWVAIATPTAHDGGGIVFESTPAELVAARSTLTGEHLAAYVGT